MKNKMAISPEVKRNMQFPFQNSGPETEGTDPRPGEDARSLRAVHVLEQLGRAQHPQTLSQLAQRLSMPKTTLMRLLDALERAGYVAHAPAERGFVPGPAATTLALTLLRTPSFTRSCVAVLSQLVAALGEACNLTALDGDQIVYVARVETDEPLRLHFETGNRVPLHCTASGKLFLASMSHTERDRVLSRINLTRCTPRTLTDPTLLHSELDRLAARGIGIDNEEFVRGMTAVSVPVRDKQGRMVAAIACHAPTARASLDDLLRALPKLQQAAQAMQKVFIEGE